MARTLPEGKAPHGARKGYFYVEFGPGLRFIEAKYYADALRPVLTYDEFLLWLKYLRFPTITIKKKEMVDMCRLETVLSGLSRCGQPDHVAGRTVIDADETAEAFEQTILELHALKLSDGLDRSKALRRRLKDAAAQAQATIRARGSAKVFTKMSPTTLLTSTSPTSRPTPSSDKESTNPTRE